MNQVSSVPDNGLSPIQRQAISNQCCVIVIWTLMDKSQWNLNQSTKPFNHEKAPENIVCDMAAILSKGDELKKHIICRSKYKEKITLMFSTYTESIIVFPKDLEFPLLFIKRWLTELFRKIGFMNNGVKLSCNGPLSNLYNMGSWVVECICLIQGLHNGKPCIRATFCNSSCYCARFITYALLQYARYSSKCCVYYEKT